VSHLDEPVTEPCRGQARDDPAKRPSASAPRWATPGLFAALSAGVSEVQVLDRDGGAAALLGEADEDADRGAHPPVALRPWQPRQH
jgi:hypothetical protein